MGIRSERRALAHVTGIVALLHELDQGLAPQRVRELLQGPRFAIAGGAALVDACSVIERVARSSVCIPLREARSAGQP